MIINYTPRVKQDNGGTFINGCKFKVDKSIKCNWVVILQKKCGHHKKRKSGPFSAAAVKWWNPPQVGIILVALFGGGRTIEETIIANTNPMIATIAIIATPSLTSLSSKHQRQSKSKE